jgi:quinol-cytochrome oxidoreductase complex cytochrome b subunit
MWQTMKHNALSEMGHKVRALPATVWHSIRRRGAANSPRAQSQAVFANFFLHIHSTRTHWRSLKPTATLGLGVAALSLFLILSATGILLMIYYKPSVSEAYWSIKDIHYVVPTGRFIRNVHRWAAHLMVVAAILHMARVFYTAAYRPPREWNWVLGISLLVLTLALSFTGYLLPWDQLAYWAMTIGANIAASPQELTDALGITSWFDIGGLQRRILLGSDTPGGESLLRFYFLHCILLPLAISVVIAVHFWRIRKDGGLAHPKDSAQQPSRTHRGEAVFARDPKKTYSLMAVVKGTSPAVGSSPEHTVSSWPHAFWAEIGVFMISFAMTLALGLLFNAPLKELANPAIPENPAKAPWYFLGLQEIVSYSAFSGGVLIPTIVLFGLMLIPYLERDREGTGVWWTSPNGRRIAAQSAAIAALVTVGLLAFTIRFGWIRQWAPRIPQLVVTLVNPGTLLVAIYTGYSLWIIARRNSIRMGAIAMFTCFLVSFTLLTYFASYHRGPNWQFYWWPTQWPVH